MAPEWQESLSLSDVRRGRQNLKYISGKIVNIAEKLPWISGSVPFSFFCFYLNFFRVSAQISHYNGDPNASLIDKH